MLPQMPMKLPLHTVHAPTSPQTVAMKEYTASQPKSDPNEGVQGVEKASLSLPARSANNESLSERPNLI